MLSFRVLASDEYNSNLLSYEELRLFKEHATVLLVSGVFILLAAGLDVDALAQLDMAGGLLRFVGHSCGPSADCVIAWLWSAVARTGVGCFHRELLSNLVFEDFWVMQRSDYFVWFQFRL